MFSVLRALNYTTCTGLHTDAAEVTEETIFERGQTGSVERDAKLGGDSRAASRAGVVQSEPTTKA